jgi:hypothetical protein
MVGGEVDWERVEADLVMVAGEAMVVDWEGLLKARLVVVVQLANQGCLHCRPEDQVAPAGGCPTQCMA